MSYSTTGFAIADHPEYAPPPAPRRTGLATAALVVGIVALVMAFIPFVSFAAFVPALAAIVLGIVALVQKSIAKGRSISGIVLGAVAMLVAAIVSVVTVIGLVGVAASQSLDNLGSDLGGVTDTPAVPDADTAPVVPDDSTSPDDSSSPDDGSSSSAIAPDVVYTGSGDSVVRIELPDGPDYPAVATISHTGSSNFVISELDSSMMEQGLLVNAIGDYSGTVPVNFDASYVATALEITADGPWTVTVRSTDSLRGFDSTPASGTGDDVLWYDGDAGSAAITHDGASNFAVWTYGDDTDLVVNEIGAYSGTALWPAGSVLVQVTADGAWTIAVQ